MLDTRELCVLDGKIKMDQFGFGITENALLPLETTGSFPMQMLRLLFLLCSHSPHQLRALSLYLMMPVMPM